MIKALIICQQTDGQMAGVKSLGKVRLALVYRITIFTLMTVFPVLVSMSVQP
jgi:hypothetical protein